MAYERFEAMIAPAREGAALWRTVIGATVSVALYVGLLLLLAGALQTLEPSGRLALEFSEGDTPRGALILLCSFAFMAAGPVLLARPLHFRSWRSYFGPPGLTTWDFLLTLRALAILAAVLWMIFPVTFAFESGLAPWRWLSLLPLTVLALLVQSGAEEIAFRGYLQSQLAARFRSPLVWMVVPSALFALGHYVPEDTGPNAIWLALLAFAFGLAAADLTARSGNLGPALAFHFANNFVALGVTALPGFLSGLALFTYPFAASDVEPMRPLILVDLVVILLSWLSARLAIRR